MHLWHISCDPIALHFVHYAGKLENHTVKCAASEKKIPIRPGKHNANNFIMVPSAVLCFIQHKWSITDKPNGFKICHPVLHIYIFIFCKVIPGSQCAGLTTLPPSCANCLEICGASTSWNPQGLSWPVMGLGREVMPDDSSLYPNM